MKRCKIHVTFSNGIKYKITPCNRPAKFKTIPDSLNKKSNFVCGIHRRSIDIMYKKQGKETRCVPLPVKGKNE